MKTLSLIFYLFVFISISCSRKEKVYVLKPNRTNYSIEFESGEIKKYKSGSFKIDNSQSDSIKISYSENSKFGKSQLLLFKEKGKYYCNNTFVENHSLRKEPFLFLSKNPSESYRQIRKLKKKELPPPIDGFKNHDDSIVFKKIGKVYKMYRKDNNTNRIASPILYFDNDYKIFKIVETVGNQKITYQ